LVTGEGASPPVFTGKVASPVVDTGEVDEHTLIWN